MKSPPLRIFSISFVIGKAYKQRVKFGEIRCSLDLFDLFCELCYFLNIKLRIIKLHRFEIGARKGLIGKSGVKPARSRHCNGE